MMGGFGMSMMMVWMPLVALFWIVLVAVVVWLVIRWLNQKNGLLMPSAPPSQDSTQLYERGYQPARQTPEYSQEGDRQYQYTQPTYEQPQAQYPQPRYEQPQAGYPRQQELPPSQ